MNNDYRPTMPSELDDLDSYPKIKKAVELAWATVELNEYLNSLLSDTRDHKRAGFPPDVSEALIHIANKNRAALTKQGYEDPEEDEFRSEFMPSQWHLPKNF
jgi:hypothetical protein